VIGQGALGLESGRYVDMIISAQQELSYYAEVNPTPSHLDGTILVCL